MHIASIGIDLGKTTFHLIALGERNKILIRKKFSRTQLLAYTTNLPASLVGLEACAGRTSWGANCDSKDTKCGSFLPSSSSPSANRTRTTSLTPKPSPRR
jgi:hypothetical protein